MRIIFIRTFLWLPRASKRYLFPCSAEINCLVPLLPKIKWAAIWQNQQNGCAPSEDSDQPGHPPSLIRVFAVRMKKHWVLSYILSAQRRLWSDWAECPGGSETSLGEHSFCWFCPFVAQILNSYIPVPLNFLDRMFPPLRPLFLFNRSPCSFVYQTLRGSMK